jgi:hypothetical protein
MRPRGQACEVSRLGTTYTVRKVRPVPSRGRPHSLQGPVSFTRDLSDPKPAERALIGGRGNGTLIGGPGSVTCRDTRGNNTFQSCRI